MLASLALIFLFGILLGALCTHLPPLIGMMATGLIFGPYFLNWLSPSLLAISADLRQLALVIILAKAGLSLDLSTLRRAGQPAVLMCFVPALFEIAGCCLIAPFLLGVSLLEAAIIGSVIAAVSPAVVVPRMLSLMERGLGEEHAVPQMVLAGASVDDVFVIIMLTVTTGLATGSSISPLVFLRVPVSILLGIIGGFLCGWVFSKAWMRIHVRDSIKVLVLLSISFLLLELETRLKAWGIPFSGLLAIMALGVTAYRLDVIRAERIAQKLGRLWVGAEFLLFALVGAAVDIRYAAAYGAAAALLVIGSLVFRMLGVAACVTRTALTLKERLFAAIAYTPKATVQAAVGGVPLALGLACGNLALTVAVLSIIITAPVGAFLIDRFGTTLLASRDKT